MKIVLLDGEALNPGDLSWAPFEALGELTVYPHGTDDQEEVIRRIGDAEIVLGNKTPVSRLVFERCPNIRLMCLVSTGYNVVDVAAAKDHGVPVCNVPAYGTEMVAQFAIGLLLEVCHHVQLHNESVHAGEWERCPNFSYWKTPIIELAGKTMGIIGMGKIGQRTAQIARAFGMKVLACSRTKKDVEGIEWVGLDELLEMSDVVTPCCPLNDGTRGIMNADAFAKMKKSAFFINTSRGGVVADADLRAALDAGEIAGAALDVMTSEPPAEDNPLFGAKNIIITPHIAWATREARERLLAIVAGNLAAWQAGSAQNTVN